MKKIALIILTMISTSACTQNQKTMKEEIIDIQTEVINNLTTYKTRPYYALQVNKNKCHVVIKVNDIPYYITFVKDEGATHLCYLNASLPKSGKQNITVEVYPKEGQGFIDEGAYVDLTLVYAPDKDTPMNEYRRIANYSLPEEVRGENVPYYKFSIPFQAEVPWDFSTKLNTAQDLKKIPNIEEKVVAKYNSFKEFIEKGESVRFIEEFKNKLKKSEYYYYNKEDLLKMIVDKEDSYIQTFVTKGANPKVEPIENYELVFGYGEKLAMLRKQQNKDHLFYYTIFEDTEEETEYWEHIVLYMPEGSNELKVW